MSKYIVKWTCSNGHTGEDALETMILADVAAAHRRMAVCEVCGAKGVGVYFREVESVPDAEPTQPEVKASKKSKAENV